MINVVVDIKRFEVTQYKHAESLRDMRRGNRYIHTNVQIQEHTDVQL